MFSDKYRKNGQKNRCRAVLRPARAYNYANNAKIWKMMKLTKLPAWSMEEMRAAPSGILNCAMRPIDVWNSAINEAMSKDMLITTTPAMTE